MKKLLHKADVNGYSPFGTLNLFIGAIPMVAAAISAFNGSGSIDAETVETVAPVAIVTFVILFLRNLKCKNIFKAIIFSILAEILGCAFLAFIIFFGGWGDPNKQSGGQSSGNSGGQQWTKQFSQTKGEYSTDGQGNFKDQYGNDVYNPQGVSDYDKL